MQRSKVVDYLKYTVNQLASLSIIQLAEEDASAQVVGPIGIASGAL
jgi:hypothetical protein